ncbi:MAG: glycosyltransferase family 39 protein [Anaerolineales bacterium]|nr:glycosyltransferase family 39 protein [Anaerolineales bacterium]
MQHLLRTIKTIPWLVDSLALLGGITYLVQSWTYAHILTTMVDEGGYLYLGHLFAQGTYHPFQDYGPATFYAPLAYLIPGSIQDWFGPGLQTGRFLAIVLGVLMLIGIWATARRLGGRWWGVAVVWAVALNPMNIQVYSLAISQVLTACMLAWILYFVLGDQRSFWHIVIGSFLCGLMVMTRQNMLPAVPLIIGYIFWQHGRKAGLGSTIASILPIAVLLLVYWPGILDLWAIWLPGNLSFTGNPDPYQVGETASFLAPVIDFEARMMVLLEGLRFNYITLVGALGTFLLWPHPKKWKGWEHKRSAIFLAIFYFSLLLAHGWASLANDFAPYAFATYLSYFNFTALLLIVASFPAWEKSLSKFRSLSIVMFALLVSIGLSYYIFNNNAGLNYDLVGMARDSLFRILRLPVPWMRDGQFLPDPVPLGGLLANLFHLDLDYLLFDPQGQRVSFIAFNLFYTILVLGILYAGFRFLSRKRAGHFTYGYIVLIATVAIGYLLSPLLEGAFYERGYCRNSDLIQFYEAIGADLSRVIPAGSQVYWGVDSPTLLLYLPDVAVYPAQIYGGYSRRTGGNTDELLRRGFWNDEAASQWAAEADYIILDEISYAEWDFATDQYGLILELSTHPCQEGYSLYVLQRVR